MSGWWNHFVSTDHGRRGPCVTILVFGCVCGLGWLGFVGTKAIGAVAAVSDDKKDETGPEAPKPEEIQPVQPTEAQKRAEEARKTRDAQRRAQLQAQQQQQQPQQDGQAAGAQPAVQPIPGQPAEPKPTPPRSSRSGPRTTPSNPVPGMEGAEAMGLQPEGPTVPINIPAAPTQDPTPPDQRRYKISIKDGTYEQLIDTVAQMTGLGVLGDLPKDGKPITFVTDTDVSFQEMLSRVRMLLFNYKQLEPYWLLYEGDHLEVKKVNDIFRILRKDQFFQSVEEFRAANLPKEELALVLYTPKGSISDLREVRNHLPDYVRVSPLEGQNRVGIFALVRDIEKYLWLADFFSGEDADVRTLKILKVQHGTPTLIVQSIQTLADFDKPRVAGGAARAGRGGVPELNPLENLPEPEVDIIPDDMLRRIVVRAMPDKLRQIEELLPIFDVPLESTPNEPVVLEVKNADCSELANTIQQILTANPAAGAQSPAATLPKRPRKGQPAGVAPQPAPVPVRVEEITLIPMPSNNTIVLLAPEEGVERVRHLVAMFDIKSEIGPVRIPLKHGDAATVATDVLSILYGEFQPGSPSPLHLVADRSGTVLWYSGTEKQLGEIKDLISVFDVEEQEAELHSAILVHQKPSFVLQLLRAHDTGEAVVPGALPSPTPAKGARGKRAAKSADVSKFTADDDNRRLYIFCNDDEWVRYEKLIEQIEQAAVERSPFFEILPLHHLAPETAIERLNSLIHDEDMSNVRMASSDVGIIVTRATQRLLGEMKAILAVIDSPLEMIDRSFEIKYVDPADMQSLLETMLGDQAGASAGPVPVPGTRPRPKKQPKAAGMPPDENMAVVVPPTPIPTLSAPLTVGRVGNKLMVRTTPPMMERVAALITEFDVDPEGSQLRVYSDFPAGADIEGIASTLSSVFGGAAPAVPGTKGVRRGRADAQEGSQFLAQQGAGKLIVIADRALLPKIEELLNVLRAAAGKETEPIVVRFFELKHADPEELAANLEPVLAMKVRRFIVTGVLAEPAMEVPPAVPGGKNRRASVGGGQEERYHIEPDVRNKRIVIAAPQVIVTEAATLIEQFDQPGVVADHAVVRTIMLKHADPAEMVKAIKELIGTGQPSRRSSRVGKGAPVVPGQPEVSDSPMTIAELPGGKGVVVRGMPEEVDQIARHIEEIDTQSIAGRIVRVYKIEHTDLRKLADLILAVVDLPDRSAMAGRQAIPRGKKSGSKKDEEEEDSGDSFDLVSTREGQEVYVQTDVMSKTMIVACNQTKMAQVEKLVAQFNIPAGEEGAIITERIPKFTYELQHKSAFDAKFDLELLLEAMWEPKNELPDVDDSPIGEFLIIRYPYEDRFEEIRGYIREHIDKPKAEDMEVLTKVLPPPPGVDPKRAAEWIRQHLPKHDLEIIFPDEGQKEEDFGIEEVKPPKQKDTQAKPSKVKVGWIPGMGGMGALAMLPAMVQPPDEEAPDPEQEQEFIEPMPFDPFVSGMAQQLMQSKGDSKEPKDSTDDSSKKGGKAPTGKVKITVDPKDGVLIFEGNKGNLEDVKDKLEDLKTEIEDLPEKPDVRIVRVRHIDVFTAAEILGDIFNSTRQQQAMMQQQQAMMMRQQQQAAQRAAQQQNPGRGQPPDGQGGPQGNQPGQPGPGGRGGAQPNPALQIPQMQLPPAQVTIVPNPRDRSLILKASTSQYPEIYKLLATIDQPKPIDSEMRVFTLEKLNASEVEEILKDFLGLDQPTAAGGGASRRSAASAAAAGMGGSTSVPNLPTLPRPVMAATRTDTQPLTVDPKDIKITSNDDTNTILVLAPKEGIEFVGDLIRQLETQEIPERVTKHYALEHADVGEVVEYLKNQFAEARSIVRGGSGRPRRGAAAENAPASGGGSSGSLANAPTFLAYSRLNMLTVQAPKPQIDEIDAMIQRLDVKAPEEDWQTVQLAHADARVVADTLTAMFGGGAPQRGRTSGGAAAPSGGAAKFIGEDGGRIVFYAAPKPLSEPILSAVDKLEAQSRDTGTVRVIDLVHAVPSDVAEAIDNAYGSRRSGGGAGSRGGRGGTGGGSGTVSGTRFTVTPGDSVKKLFVMADDEMFGRIESLAKTLDIPRKMDIQFKIYPMKFANAKSIHATLSKMVTDYIRMMPNKGAIEPFSVEVDEKANALVVLGGPMVFGFVEEALVKADTQANAGSPPGFLMMVLKNADAQEVAANITKLWGQKQLAAGEQPPQVEANRTTNAIFVRGTQAQIDEIKKQFIDPLESQTLSALRSETIKLQHAQAEVVAESVKRIFDDKKLVLQQSGPGRTIPPLELAVAITPEVNTNQIIVQASETNLELIRARIAELDRPDVALQAVTTTKTYVIKFADPNNLATMIREWSKTRVISTPSGKTAPRDQVIALAEPATQSLVVTASEANHKQIELILKEVDTDRAVGGEVRVIPILYGDATEMVTAVTEMIRKPGGGSGRGAALTGDIRVSVLTQGNAIVISGDKDEVESLEKTVKALDTSGEKSSVPQIVPLSHARVAQMLPTVQAMFEAPAGGGSARRNQPPPTITVDEVGNTFIVRGSQTDVAAIKGLVAQLDTPEQASQKPWRVVPVTPGMNLSQLADDIQSLVNESAKAQSSGTTGSRTRPPPSVTITPNTRTGTLVLAGSPMLFDQVEELVRDLEKRGPSSADSIRVLDLPNITPEEIEALMEQLTGERAGRSGGARPNTPARPSSGTNRPRGSRP